MGIAIIVTDRDTSILRQSIKQHLKEDVEVWDYQDKFDVDRIQMAILWKQPQGILDEFPNLKLVSSLGAGVEHIVNDPTIPAHLSITRIVTDSLTQSMFRYVLLGILRFEKEFPYYYSKQQQQVWLPKKNTLENSFKVGVLGLGALGGVIAQQLSELGYDVFGYSRTSKNITGVKSYSTSQISLAEFFSKVNVVVNLLPLTPSTYKILNYNNLKHLPKGSFLINVARGKHLVEPDLLKCLEDEIIQGALLDVFQEEPLPQGHPFWNHPAIFITPHIASITSQEDAGVVIANNFERLLQNEPLIYQVDRGEAY